MTDELVVSVEEGKLQGVKNRSDFSGVEFYSFYGIPYAEPPISNLRFRDPVAAKSWKSIRDATIEKKSGCRQYSLHTFSIVGSEDCLYNNIHTSKLPSKGEPLLPVVVCIHPGGFRYGSPESWHYGSPNYVIHNDIVYVGIGDCRNCHLIGFLNLNMKECSGNQGLKDIILGLKWIQRNIHNFNGDPNNVTLLGSSCGAIIIELLMLSPVAKGLFHKAVMSSYVFSPYSTFGYGNEHVAFQVASMAGFKTTNKRQLLKFLKKMSIDRFLPLHKECEKAFEKTIAPIYPQSMFSPTIDVASENPILPVPPRKLIDTMSLIPIMYGVCDREAVLGFATEKARKSTEKSYRKAYRQNKWGWMHELNDHEIEIINKEIEAYFFKDYSKGSVPLEVKEKMMTSVSGFDVYDTLLNPIAKKLPASVYLYKFRFESDVLTFKNLILRTMDEKLNGTYHGSDYSYWSCRSQELSRKSASMINTYTKLITTFARNGNPTYKQLEMEWKPYTVENPCYLSIGETLEMVDGVFVEGVELWEEIKKRFKKE